MIGAFARMIGSRDRVLSVEETEGRSYEVKACTDEGRPSTTQTADAPPEAFVERVPHEGGDVIFSPVLETLRAVLQKARATLPRSSGKSQTQPPTQETP